MQVVWSGTLERAAAEEVRRCADYTERQNATKAVLACVRRLGEATSPMLQSALKIDSHRINSALHLLKERGELVMCDYGTKTGRGRTAHFYRVK